MAKKSGYKAFKAFPINKTQGTKIAKKDPSKQKKKNTKKGGKVKKSYLHIEPKQIGCKMKRLDILEKRKKEANRLKKKQKLQRKEENEQTGKKPLEPITIEDKREVDENFVFEEDEELEGEEKHDEFQDYFDSKVTPQILMTTSEHPKGTMFQFLQEVKDAFPNCHYWPRKGYTLKQISEYAQTKQYTDIMVWRESKR